MLRHLEDQENSFQMSMLLSLFLLFYCLCGLEARAQEIKAAANDLEAVFRLEDELEARPFLLESGEKYRDLLTITAARNVGEFGIIRSHSQPGQTTVKTARCAENWTTLALKTVNDYPNDSALSLFRQVY